MMLLKAIVKRDGTSSHSVFLVSQTNVKAIGIVTVPCFPTGFPTRAAWGSKTAVTLLDSEGRQGVGDIQNLNPSSNGET